MKYIIIKHNQPIFHFDINLEVSLKNLLALIKEAIGSESSSDKSDKENPTPPKENKSLFLSIIIFLIVLLLYSINCNEVAENKNVKSSETTLIPKKDKSTSKDKLYRYYRWQCKFVIQEFNTEFWKYTHQNKIFKVEDFKKIDKKNLKEELWCKLLKTREIFSSLEGMSELEKKVSVYYKYDLFDKDFDTFMTVHSKGSLLDFEREMIEYIRNKQNDILEKIIDL